MYVLIEIMHVINLLILDMVTSDTFNKIYREAILNPFI